MPVAVSVEPLIRSNATVKVDGQARILLGRRAEKPLYLHGTVLVGYRIGREPATLGRTEGRRTPAIRCGVGEGP
jgi:hypothetical protein